MDWHITLHGTSPDEGILVSDDQHVSEETPHARDHTVAAAVRDLIGHLRDGGHRVEDAVFGAGNIRGGSVDLLAGPSTAEVTPDADAEVPEVQAEATP